MAYNSRIEAIQGNVKGLDEESYLVRQKILSALQTNRPMTPDQKKKIIIKLKRCIVLAKDTIHNVNHY